MAKIPIRRVNHIVLYAVLAAGVLISLFTYLAISSSLKILAQMREDREAEKLEQLYFDKSLSIRPSFLPTPTGVRDAPLKLPVLMYHYVEYVADKKDTVRIRLSTPPHVFESHLKELKEQGYDSFFAKDIPFLLDGVTFLPPRSIVLTFDDGYEDFYTTVFPLLKKYHMRATVYVIADYTGTKGFLTHDQLLELSTSGLVEIGSHTLNHPYLKTVADEEARLQIAQSKEKLEAELGIDIVSFAYPYGAMSQQAISYVKQAGYTNAVSVISGTLQSGENLYYLSRIRPEILIHGAVASTIENLRK